MSADLPQNLEAERCALGSVLISPSKWPLLAASLVADSFFLPAHREIYSAMLLVAATGAPLDEVAIGAELDRRGGARLHGELLDLASHVPTSENAAHYVAIVDDCHRRRRLIALCAETASRAHGESACGDLLASAASGLSALAMRSDTSLLRAGDLAAPLLEEFEARAASRGKGGTGIDGVRVGVPLFDETTLGWRGGNLVVIAADPGGGKTALANQAAYTLCMEDNGTALVFNLEMTRAELVERAFVRLARINSQRLKRGDIEHGNWAQLQRTGARLVAASMYVEDRLFTLAEIVARTREWRAKHPDARGMVAVDYLQLMRSTNDRENRAREIGRWCGTLKELAKELNVTCVIVSQLNRAAHQAGQKPTMRNLRDSGEIEQAADCIVLLHNESGSDDGTVDAIIEKNRSGPRRIVPMHWTARYYEFSEARDYAAGAPDYHREQEKR